MNFLKTILLLNNYLTKTILILLLTSSCFTFAQAQFAGTVGDGGCAIEQATKAIYKANPGMKEQIKAQLEALKNQPPQHKSGTLMDNVVPIVFHIIPTPCGATFDFTKSDLQSIVDEVNVDFAGQNTSEYNASIDPTFYPIRAGDVGLTFRLAEVDPSGNPTDGFTRPTTSFYSYNGGVDKILKDIVRWDNRKYLNVWVVEDVANASGFAHYPYTAIVQPEIDGIVMDKDYLINGTTEKTNRPNILTHEIGHWLGLLHAWGDPYYDVTDDGRSCEPNNQQGDCGCDDLVNDTPKCERFVSTTCPSNLPTTCNGSPHNVHNMMDYGCEVMFTQGQANRMWSMINNNIGGRGEVVTNNNDPSVFMDSRADQNDAKLYLDKVVFRESDSNSGTISETGIIELRDCNGCSFSNNITFTTSGLPSSISNNIQITKLNNTQAQISFNINLTNPDDHSDDIENFSITLNQNAIAGTSQVFNNRTIGGLKIDFRKEGLAFNGQSSATFATDDFTAIFIPYLGTEVGFSRQSVNDGSIRMYALAPLEAAVTSSNSFNVKRLGDNQSVNGESFREITGGAPNDPDNLILYQPGVYTDWLNQTGYVGLRANTCGITYYAWIRIEVTSAGVNILDMVVHLENNAPLNTGQYPVCDPPRSYDTNFIYLESVNIGQINNVSGNNNGYQFFQNYTTDLIEGQTYTLDCEGNKPQAGYEGEWRVYIDLNGDGSYLDPDDLRYIIDDREEINANVELVPAGTLNGQTELNTKMMVVFSLYPLRSLCEDYQYGETEEYNVTLKSSGGGTPVYCDSQGNNTQYEFIQNVNVAGINNTSGDNGGYADFTAQTANVDAGSSYVTILTPNFPQSPYTEHWRVWIDFNKDGDFTDSGEELLSESSNAAISSTISIPASAPSGTTRMRVTMNYSSTVAPCGGFQYGEVEDYTVNIGGSACNIGSPCNDNDVCTTNDVYDANCNCVGTYVDADNDGVCAANDCDDNDSSIPATPGTNCNDGDSNTTGDIIQADGCTCEGTLPQGNEYCEPTGLHPQIYISNVSLEQIDNTTGLDGYGDYTNQLADLSQGQSYTLSVTESTPWSFYWRGWIDYDQSGTFETNELILSANNASGTFQQNIIVPANALTGTTRMRISLKYSNGAAPQPCDNISLGEVEDYSITIQQTTSSCNAAVPTSGDISVGAYCNYAYGYCNGHSGNNKEFELTNLSTGSASTYASSSHYANFQNLSQNTNYQFRVRIECGNTGTYGGWSPYQNFTTSSCKLATEILNLNNYPNPFNDFTTIEFSLPNDNPITLHIYDLTGRRVATLLDNELTIAGNHRVRFDGQAHPSGMYIYTIQAGEYTAKGKMNILR